MGPCTIWSYSVKPRPDSEIPLVFYTPPYLFMGKTFSVLLDAHVCIVCINIVQALFCRIIIYRSLGQPCSIAMDISPTLDYIPIVHMFFLTSHYVLHDCMSKYAAVLDCSRPLSYPTLHTPRLLGTHFYS